jgi:hypothetical protein
MQDRNLFPDRHAPTANMASIMASLVIAAKEFSTGRQSNKFGEHSYNIVKLLCCE